MTILHWSPDSRRLGFVSGARSLTVRDVSANTEFVVTPSTPIVDVSWSPDSALIAVACTDGSVVIVHSDSGEQLHASSVGHEVHVTEAVASTVDTRPGRAGDSARGVEVTTRIPVHRIRELIGPKGVVIRSIETRASCDVDVEDDGEVMITAATDAGAQLALSLIDQIINPPRIAAGDSFVGHVATIVDYGAFVNILPGRDGLLHVNKLGSEDWVVDITSVLEVGQEIDVVVEAVLDNGKISLDLARPLGS